MAEKQNYRVLFGEENTNTFEWGTFIITYLLIGLGLVSIYSSVYSTGSTLFFDRQVIYTVLGSLVLFATMYVPEIFLQRYASYIYGFSIFLLVVVLIPGLGTTVYGTSGWLSIGGFTIQPSEFAKLGTIIMVSSYLSYKGKDVRTLRDFGIVLAIILLPVFLVIQEPDVGSATVFMAILLGVLLWTGFDIFLLFFIVSLPIVFILSLISNSYFFISSTILSAIAVSFRKRIVLTVVVIATIIGVGYASNLLVNSLAPHQQKRIETFLDPEKDPLGAGYNVRQSIMAVGNGGITGQGYLEGSQTQYQYIPKQWTDFIFSVPAEEFGFVGAFVVLGLLTFLIFRIIKIANEVISKFFSIMAIGGASLLFYHSLINIGMAIGIMPVMGIPLPFLSAGGSSLLANMALIGLMMNAYRSNKKPKF